VAMQARIWYDMTGASAVNRLVIYVTAYCGVCRYAHEVADDIRHRYPQVNVELIDIDASPEAKPDDVFATPTYVLDGRVWSLGNPSEAKIRDAFG
jgi:hypothetical protein